MGYLIRHIHNRDLAAENIMTAYTRLRFVLHNYPTSAASLSSRLGLCGLQLPERSMLALCNEVRLFHFRMSTLVSMFFGIMSTGLCLCRRYLENVDFYVLV